MTERENSGQTTYVDVSRTTCAGNVQRCKTNQTHATKAEPKAQSPHRLQTQVEPQRIHQLQSIGINNEDSQLYMPGCIRRFTILHWELR